MAEPMDYAPIKTFIKIPGELPSLNQIIETAKINVHKYSNMKKLYTNICATSALGLFMIDHKVDVQVNWYTKDNRIDPDNQSVGGKFIFDGFVQAGLLKGDSRKHIRSIAHTFNTDKFNPRIEVTLTKIE